MIVIEKVELSSSTVTTGKTFIISVSIVTHGYLKTCTHKQLKEYTHGKLRRRGETVPTYAELVHYKHSNLSAKTHRQIETMEVTDGS